MIRDFFTNKWIIGGIAVLCIVTASCYFWYQHEITPYKREDAKTDELFRQSQTQKVPETDSQIRSTPDALVEKNTQTTNDVPNKAEDYDSASTEEPTEGVPASPFGFGPFPEVPEDYFGDPIWARNPDLFSEFPDEASRNIELIDRVLIKLWQQGDREIVGGSTYNGKVYPHYDNVFYVRWTEIPLPDGNVHRYISRLKGGDHEITDEDIESGNIPAGSKVVDLDNAGFDPYKFLNLKQSED